MQIPRQIARPHVSSALGDEVMPEPWRHCSTPCIGPESLPCTFQTYTRSLSKISQSRRTVGCFHGPRVPVVMLTGSADTFVVISLKSSRPATESATLDVLSVVTKKSYSPWNCVLTDAGDLLRDGMTVCLTHLHEEAHASSFCFAVSPVCCWDCGTNRQCMLYQCSVLVDWSVD